MHFDTYWIFVPIPPWVTVLSILLVVGSIGFAIWYDHRPRR